MPRVVLAKLSGEPSCTAPKALEIRLGQKATQPLAKAIPRQVRALPLEHFSARKNAASMGEKEGFVGPPGRDGRKAGQFSNWRILMSFGISILNIRPSNSTSSVRAYVDIRLNLDMGAFKVSGISVIETEGKSPWVALPQKPGKNAKKYFPVVEAEGKLKELITNAVLDAYEGSKN